MNKKRLCPTKWRMTTPTLSKKKIKSSNLTTHHTNGKVVELC